MTAKELLFSSPGRIGRFEFLLGACALAGAGVILEKLVVLSLGWVVELGVSRHGATGPEDSVTVLLFLVSALRAYLGPLFLLLCLVPLYFLVAKRCRDRKRGGAFAVIFTLALALLFIFPMLRPQFASPAGLLAELVFSSAYLRIALAVLWIWAIVELVLLRGRAAVAEAA